MNGVRQHAPLDYHRRATGDARVAPASVVPSDRKDVNEHSAPRINYRPVHALAAVIQKPEPPRAGLTTVSAHAKRLRTPYVIRMFGYDPAPHASGDPSRRVTIVEVRLAAIPETLARESTPVFGPPTIERDEAIGVAERADATKRFH